MPSLACFKQKRVLNALLCGLGLKGQMTTYQLKTQFGHGLPGLLLASRLLAFAGGLVEKSIGGRTRIAGGINIGLIARLIGTRALVLDLDLFNWLLGDTLGHLD